MPRVTGVRRKKIFRRVFVSIGCVLLGLPLIIGAVLYRTFSNEPFMDDGPFTGRFRSNCNLSNPNGTLELPDRSLIQVFNPTTETESPTVRRLTRDGSVSWCIYADGHEKTQVFSLNLSSAQKDYEDRLVVKGVVHWTFGRERTLWYLSRNGDLINYWYSW
jgi:hypothetical protein